MTRRTKVALERQVVRLIAERDREAELSAIAVARAGELEVQLARGEKGEPSRCCHRHAGDADDTPFVVEPGVAYGQASEGGERSMADD